MSLNEFRASFEPNLLADAAAALTTDSTEDASAETDAADQSTDTSG